MYFPYLRGRQFELIAIRELLENNLISESIIPVIEPVKLSSTLIKTLHTYIRSERPIGIIHNPKVGNFINDLKEESQNKDKYLDLLKSSYVLKFHIVNDKSEEEIEILNELGIPHNEIGVVLNDRDNYESYKVIFSDEEPKYSFIIDDRKIRRSISAPKVLFEDKFSKLERNVDYIGVDEFFSEDHKFYEEEGYVGFSDYSIVGDLYSESGFAPFAVALHIAYFDDELELRIIHFVSDSNDDIKDPAGKFYQALTKLILWLENNPSDTLGIREFRKHYKEGTYPGLGTVKKLSIMHHIELINQYLMGKCL